MLLEFENYRQYLKALLAERVQSNPAYSLRAMARHLGVTSSQFSEVLGGKANFSQPKAVHIAKKLELDDNEMDYFCLLVQLESETDLSTQELLLKKLNRLRKDNSRGAIYNLSLDQFRQISDWYHSAILELIEVPNFKFSAATVAKTLGISKLDAEVAIERLERLELLSRGRDDLWIRTQDDIHVKSPTRNAAMRNFYKQMMQKAAVALEQQEPEQRLSAYETMSFAAEAIPEAKKAIKRFCDEIYKISRKYPHQTEVYHLLVHFFSLTPGQRKKSKL